MSAYTRAPWTDDQVAALNRYQTKATMHPFTCGRREDHPENDGVLVATHEGWVCTHRGCGYTQDWAHDWMANPAAVDMIVRGGAL